MGKPGPRQINRCSIDFKLKAMQMSELRGMLIKDVASPCVSIRSRCLAGASRDRL